MGQIWEQASDSSSAGMWEVLGPFCKDGELCRVADEAEEVQAPDLTELASQPNARGQKRKADDEADASNSKLRKFGSGVTVSDTTDDPIIIVGIAVSSSPVFRLL